MKFKNQLDAIGIIPEAKDACLKFSEAFKKQQVYLGLSTLPKNTDTMDVFKRAIYDHPEVMYLDQTYIENEPASHGYKVKFRLIGSFKDIAEKNEKLKRAASDIIQSLPVTDSDPPEKILTELWNWFLKNLHYDYEERYAMMDQNHSIHLDSHNAYGALVTHLAVCDGIAEAMKLLLSHYKISSGIVIGSSMSEGSQDDSHAWLLVRRPGSFCTSHFDPTWDICYFGTTGKLSYRYFGKTDDQMKKSHMWDVRLYPKASDSFDAWKSD